MLDLFRNLHFAGRVCFVHLLLAKRSDFEDNVKFAESHKRTRLELVLNIAFLCVRNWRRTALSSGSVRVFNWLIELPVPRKHGNGIFAVSCRRTCGDLMRIFCRQTGWQNLNSVCAPCLGAAARYLSASAPKPVIECLSSSRTPTHLLLVLVFVRKINQFWAIVCAELSFYDFTRSCTYILLAVGKLVFVKWPKRCCLIRALDVSNNDFENYLRKIGKWNRFCNLNGKVIYWLALVLNSTNILFHWSSSL